MFRSRRKSAQSEAEAQERIKQAAEEAERQRKAQEVTAINAEVAKRLRRHSGEKDENEMASVLKAVSEDEEKKTPSGATTAKRRASTKVHRVSGEVTAKELDSINKLVKQRENEREARRARAMSADATLDTSFIRKQAEAAMAAAAEAADAYPVGDGRALGSPATDDDEAAPRSKKKGERAVASKHGPISSRERLAQMKREADEKKMSLGLAASKELGADDGHAADHGDGAARVVRMAQARAAAKLAGGVFYTYDENADLLSKMKALQRTNEEQQRRLDKLDALVDAVSKYTEHASGAAHEAPSYADLDVHIDGRSASFTQKSPGFMRSPFARAFSQALGGFGASPGPSRASLGSSPSPTKHAFFSPSPNKDQQTGGWATTPAEGGSPNSAGASRRSRRLSAGTRSLAVGVANALAALSSGPSASGDHSGHGGNRVLVDARGFDGVAPVVVRPPTA